jgi:hypothetical protein
MSFLGKFQFTTKTWIIIGIIAFVIIIGAVAATSTQPNKINPKSTPTPIANQPTPGPPPTIAFTVQSAVGVQSIVITNQNTGSTITLTTVDLPKTITVKYDNTLTLKVNAVNGYRFNYWQFGDGQVDAHNPYTVKVSYSQTMEARFLMDVNG